jgi:hypothetical protein
LALDYKVLCKFARQQGTFIFIASNGTIRMFPSDTPEEDVFASKASKFYCDGRWWDPVQFEELVGNKLTSAKRNPPQIVNMPRGKKD